MKICCSIVLFILLGPAGLWGQQTQNRQAAKAYEEAQAAIVAKDYETAIPLLYTAIQEDPEFITAYQVLGDLFRLKGDFNNAITNYRKVIEQDPDFSPRTWYGLGLGHYHQEAYEDARKAFEQALPGLKGNKTLRIQIEKYLSNCNFALEAQANPVAFHPENLGSAINSTEDEYLPALRVDAASLVFTRKGAKGEDFYHSMLSEGNWQSALPLSESINSPGFNEGSASLSPDGQTIYFTICGRPDGMGSCDIYSAHFDGEQWSAPENIGGPVNSRAWESQPSLSPDGKTLYFASNRAGTLGGIDLWYSTRQEDGSWTLPVNLGDSINTAYEEQVPFIHADNRTLYFTSEGWPGMGGKDIYVSRRTANGWTRAINLGYPVNTSKDESGLVVSADGQSGFFASNSLEGSGGYDLYRFEMPREARPNYVSYIRGKVKDEASGQPLAARIELIDLESGELLFSSHSNKLDGAFLASLPAGNDYVFNISASGYLFHSGSFFLEDQTVTEPYQLEIGLKKIASGEKVVLNNIFFETDSYKLKPSSNVELDKVIQFMRENPSLVIEISGHTDDVGSDDYNLELSENRAKAVYAYLVRGILKPERFRFKGYGESQPIADNGKEEGRAKNRRTELKIVSP